MSCITGDILGNVSTVCRRIQFDSSPASIWNRIHPGKANVSATQHTFRPQTSCANQTYQLLCEDAVMMQLLDRTRVLDQCGGDVLIALLDDLLGGLRIGALRAMGGLPLWLRSCGGLWLTALHTSWLALLCGRGRGRSSCDASGRVQRHELRGLLAAAFRHRRFCFILLGAGIGAGVGAGVVDRLDSASIVVLLRRGQVLSFSFADGVVALLADIAASTLPGSAAITLFGHFRLVARWGCWCTSSFISEVGLGRVTRVGRVPYMHTISTMRSEITFGAEATRNL